jgi:hypothetical protein
MTLDVKNFYLKLPMVRHKYVQIEIDDIFDKIIVEYIYVTRYQAMATYTSKLKGDVWIASGRDSSTGVIEKGIE